MTFRRSNLVLALASLTLVGSLLLSGCAPITEAAQLPADSNPTRTITVVGQGEVKVRPDIANINVGVEVLAPTVEAATGAAERQMNAVLAAIKKLGIADKDIQTSNFAINFERQTSDVSLPRAEGTSGDTESTAGNYRVSNMVQVTIRDLDQVGAVLGAAVQAGANSVWGVSYSLDETQTLEATAREAAVKDARSRAEALAQLNNVGLGDVIAVSEVVGGASPVFAETAMRDYAGASVEPGELTFSKQIQITYAIR